MFDMSPNILGMLQGREDMNRSLEASRRMGAAQVAEKMKGKDRDIASTLYSRMLAPKHFRTEHLVHLSFVRLT